MILLKQRKCLILRSCANGKVAKSATHGAGCGLEAQGRAVVQPRPGPPFFRRVRPSPLKALKPLGGAPAPSPKVLCFFPNLRILMSVPVKNTSTSDRCSGRYLGTLAWARRHVKRTLAAFLNMLVLGLPLKDNPSVVRTACGHTAFRPESSL